MLEIASPLSKTLSVILVGAVLVLATVVGYGKYTDYISQLRTKQNAAAVEGQKLNAQISDLKSTLQNTSDVDLRTEIWTAPQAGALTASVQARVGELARTAGLTLRNISPQTATGFGETDATGIRVEGEAPSDRLAKFLQAAETHQPALLVTRANLRRLNRARTQDPYPILFFQIDVTAPSQVSSAAQ